MSILDHPLITARYFFPYAHGVPDPTWVDVGAARLACHSRRAGKPLTVVHFHGNGEVVADYVPHFEDLCADLGADCFLAEYRGYGDSTGEPQLAAMLDDIPHIFAAVGRPPEEIVVFGRSVGSIYAIEFASRYPVAGLVLESGIADAGERVLMRATPAELGVSQEAFDAEIRARLNHAAKLHGRARPTLVMHTRHDALVDASHALRLASFPSGNVRLVLFERGDHNSVFIDNRAEYVAELAQLLELARTGGSYSDEPGGVPAPADRTQEGGLAVFEDTDEFLALNEQTRELAAPTLRRRTGPGQTAPMEVPPELRTRREGPGQTQVTERARTEPDESD